MTCSFSRQRMMPESRELHAFKLMMLVCCPICSSVGKRRGGRGIGSISTYYLQYVPPNDFNGSNLPDSCLALPLRASVSCNQNYPNIAPTNILSHRKRKLIH